VPAAIPSGIWALAIIRDFDFELPELLAEVTMRNASDTVCMISAPNSSRSRDYPQLLASGLAVFR
jgi:hypothetical protein